MSNPTTPFSWQMPTATDLVTDLPADFEVFGQAVATSMQYLLGGTTGQILSKTSATDMAFTWINNDQGDLTAITAGSGISVTSGTGPIPTVALDLASANTFTAAQTATRFIVTGSTVATNGMYLSAANTLAFSTNSTAQFRIDSSGNVGITTPSVTFVRLNLGGSGLTASSGDSRGISLGVTFPQTATTVMRNYYSAPATEAAVYTAASLRHFSSANTTIGAGSTLSNQYGFFSDALSGATNNYAFYGNSAAAANNYNFYAAGTAANYFAGRTGVGIVLTSSAQFGVTNLQGTGEVTVLTRNFAAQTSNSISVQNSASSQVWGVSAAGFMQYISGNTATTVGAAGLASALPANPTGYLKIDIGGTEFKVPYYAA